MNENIACNYTHLCFPRTLQGSVHGTKDKLYFECSETKDRPGVLYLFTKHDTYDVKIRKYRASNLHWVKVEVCPFCEYKPDDKAEGFTAVND